MDKTSFLLHLDEILGLAPGTLAGNEELEGLESWDSMAVLGFLTFARERSARVLAPKDIRRCCTVDDLYAVATAEGNWQ